MADDLWLVMQHDNTNNNSTNSMPAGYSPVKNANGRLTTP